MQQIKNKLINHLMQNGKKRLGETIFLKSIKELQKKSIKRCDKIIQLALINTTPVFRLHKLKPKRRKKKKKKKIKEIPGFLKNKYQRTSAAIKFILLNTKKKNQSLSQKLSEEILLNAENKGNSVELRNKNQQTILVKKRLFWYYRWN